MTEPVRWDSAVKDLLELVQANGHRLSVFNFQPPDILPSGKAFDITAKCLTCGGLISVDWNGRELNARGSLLYEQCKKQ